MIKVKAGHSIHHHDIHYAGLNGEIGTVIFAAWFKPDSARDNPRYFPSLMGFITLQVDFGQGLISLLFYCAYF